MPTTKRRKRITLPDDPDEAAIFERVVDDHARTAGLSWSEALADIVRRSAVPATGPARARAEAVYSGREDLLQSVGVVLDLNSSGQAGFARCPGYRPIVEFGADLLLDKGCVLDTAGGHMGCLRERLGWMVDELRRREAEAADSGDTLREFDLHRAADHGADLLGLAAVEQRLAAAHPYAAYALAVFDEIGDRTCTTVMLSALFKAADETALALEFGHGRRVPPDTPAQRRGWIGLLDAHAEEWALLI